MWLKSVSLEGGMINSGFIVGSVCKTLFSCSISNSPITVFAGGFSGIIQTFSS